MMSEAVVFYQLSIFASVIGIGVIFNQRAGRWVAIGWAIWTLVMVFTHWLFIFQFAVIFMANIISKSYGKSPSLPATQRTLRKTTFWLVGLAAVGLVVANYPDRQSHVDYVAPTTSTYVEPAHAPYVPAEPESVKPLQAISTDQDISTEGTVEQTQFFKCSEKRGKETRVSFQDFPCGTTRYSP